MYIQGVRISKNEGTERTRVHYEREKRTSYSLLGFCSVIDPGCKCGGEECKEQIRISL